VRFSAEGQLDGIAGLARRAAAIAGQLDHPVYDCLYLALAEAEQTKLVTADLQSLGKVRTNPIGAPGGQAPPSTTLPLLIGRGLMTCGKAAEPAIPRSTG